MPHRILREDDSLLSAYGLEFAHVLLEALRLADKDDPALGTIAALTSSLDHVKRMLEKRSALFADSRAPRVGEITDMSMLLDRLWVWLSQPETAARRGALSLFTALRIGTHTSPDKWLRPELAVKVPLLDSQKSADAQANSAVLSKLWALS